MNVEPVELWCSLTKRPLQVDLHWQLGLRQIEEAESQWRPWRIYLRDEFHKAGVPIHKQPESLHWDWVAKLAKYQEEDFGALGVYRCVGLHSRGLWQGLLYTTLDAPSRLALGRQMAYVKYVEAAPWNWAMPAIGRDIGIKGIGCRLILAALKLSRDCEHLGRIGLHALPQAESFYRDKCRMTVLERDPECGNLLYFEMTEQQARAFEER